MFVHGQSSKKTGTANAGGPGKSGGRKGERETPAGCRRHVSGCLLLFALRERFRECQLKKLAACLRNSFTAPLGNSLRRYVAQLRNLGVSAKRVDYR